MNAGKRHAHVPRTRSLRSEPASGTNRNPDCTKPQVQGPLDLGGTARFAGVAVRGRLSAGCLCLSRAGAFFRDVSGAFRATADMGRNGIAAGRDRVPRPRRAAAPVNAWLLRVERDSTGPVAARTLWSGSLRKAFLFAIGEKNPASLPARFGAPAASAYASLPPRRDKTQIIGAYGGRARDRARFDPDAGRLSYHPQHTS